MFSGITQGLFPIIDVVRNEKLLHYTVALNDSLIKNLKVGASVAIDGVCQTVVGIKQLCVSFDAIDETLIKTTLNELYVNRQVSVERSLTHGEEVGGHLVSGHVFEKGLVIDKKINAENYTLTIQCSKKCLSFLVTKGFIAVDGSSLTLGKINKERSQFEIHLIPETLRVTNFSKKNVGDHVNLEPDMQTMRLVESLETYLKPIELRLNAVEKQLGQ